MSFHLFQGILHKRELVHHRCQRLLQAATSLFHLIPFVVVTLIPFLRFTLPMVLGFFPGVLPDAFRSGLRTRRGVGGRLGIGLRATGFLRSVTRRVSNKRSDNGLGSLGRLFGGAEASNVGLATRRIFTVDQRLKGRVALSGLAESRLDSLYHCVSLGIVNADGFLHCRVRQTLRGLGISSRVVIGRNNISDLALRRMGSTYRTHKVHSVKIPRHCVHDRLTR